MNVREFFLDQGALPSRGRLHSALLTGPSRSGKTTLLFQYACNLVVEQGYTNVVFICKRSNMKDDPPYLPEDMNTSADHLRKISFKYVKDDEDLDKYFAAFHLSDPMPQALVIDGFGDLFEDWIYEDDEGEGQPSEVAIFNSLSYCLDAMDYASKSLPSGQSCKLLISDVHDDALGYMYIYKKYLKQFFVIRALNSSKFLLSEEGKEDTCYACYEFNDSPIQLETLSC